MKFKSVIVVITFCAALAVVSGCKKQDDAAVPATPTASQAPAPDAAKAVDAVKSAPTPVTAQASTPVTDQVSAPVTNQVSAGEQQAQGLIDRAKAYVADQKYQDALSSLSQLASSKLTAEQQKTVDSLKAQIQTALAKATATDPASALGGALGGKK